MADDLDENFLLDEKIKAHSDSEDDNEEEEQIKSTDSNEAFENSNSQQPNQTGSINKDKTKKKKKNKRLNISELLKLRGDQFDQDDFQTNEFKSQMVAYLNKHLSSVEKNELNLSDQVLNERLSEMIMKPAKKLNKNSEKVKKVLVSKLFQKKLGKKCETYLKSSKATQKQAPFIIILCQSAVRCIEVQRELDLHVDLLKQRQMLWMHAFAKHKKLDEQIEYIKKQRKQSTHLVYATPKRFEQLLDAECFDLKHLKYVLVDYTHRDVKLKRLFDLHEIRVDFMNLCFKHLLRLNKEKVKFKFLLA
jgi:hypothetical protein